MIKKFPWSKDMMALLHSLRVMQKVADCRRKIALTCKQSSTGQAKLDSEVLFQVCWNKLPWDYVKVKYRMSYCPTVCHLCQVEIRCKLCSILANDKKWSWVWSQRTWLSQAEPAADQTWKRNRIKPDLVVYNILCSPHQVPVSSRWSPRAQHFCPS